MSELSPVASEAGRPRERVETIVAPYIDRADRAARHFRNALCVLRSIDMDELVEAGVLTGAEWPAFRDHPYRGFLHLDDAERGRCWALIERRMQVAV